MTTKTISPMELITLLLKSKQTIKTLSLAESSVLTYLLACANLKDGEGYKCWPSTDTISESTGIHSKTVEKARKTLVDGGWMKYIQGKGKGNCNTYYINGFKIVEVYMLSGNKKPEGIVAASKQIEPTKERVKNTSGLMKGNASPKSVAPPIVPDKPIDSKPGLNPDGSPPFFPNGARRYTKDDIMPVMDDSPEEPSIPVQKVNYFEEDLDIPF